MGPQLERVPGERGPSLSRRGQPSRVRHPECDSIHDLVVHDKAGERILEQLLTFAEQRLREEGIRGIIYLFKNNTDSAGNSYGCHENYLTSRRDDFGHYAEVLIPFLVSRQIYAGAGKVLQTARGAMYCISQRAEHIWEGVSSATTRSRPIINTRDEPYADAERYRRLHVIVGDSNMSEYATFLKVGATSLLLHARGPVGGAAGHDPREPDPGHPGDQPRPHLPQAGAPGPRPGGQRPRHPDRVPQPGAALRRQQGGQPLEEQALAMWEHCLTGLAKDPLSLDRECDWVIKHNLIHAYRDRHDLALTHPRVALMDLQYHDVNRAGPLLPPGGAGDGRSDVLRGGDRPCRARLARAAPDHPGPTAGEFIRRAKERRRDYTVDWVHLKLNDQAQRTVLCKDPFKSRDERVERLIASL